LKTISPDQTHIDYTCGDSGVRVWAGQCQAIGRDDQESNWIGREDLFPVPVPDSILGVPHSGTAPTTVLAFEVARYDEKQCDPELRGLLKGWMTFEEAILAV
jgi:hypothetical protein